MNFYSTEVGEKYVSGSEYANRNIEKYIAQKQRDTVKKEAEIYNKKVEDLQTSSH